MIKTFFIRSFTIFLILTALLILGIMAFIKSSPQFGATPAGKHLEKITVSENYRDGTFANQITTSMDMNFKSGIEVMYQFFFEGQRRTPNNPLPVKFDEHVIIRNKDSAKITWYGHSAILLEMDGKKILLDPMLGNASSPVPFLSKRFSYQKPINLEMLPEIDAVILSHDHYDHLDHYSIVKLKDRVTHFYTPLGVGSHLKKWGVTETKITELDWWQTAALEDINMIAAPARHFSGRGLTDRNKTQWASWIIIGSKEKIYFSGDSGYGPHFKEIGNRFGPFDFAMMECGQYNERWEAIHMLPEQTLKASQDIKAKRMMPIHWSAFNLSLHSWTEPVERATRAAKNYNIEIITPYIGQRFLPSMNEEYIKWWEGL